MVAAERVNRRAAIVAETEDGGRKRKQRRTVAVGAERVAERPKGMPNQQPRKREQACSRTVVLAVVDRHGPARMRVDRVGKKYRMGEAANDAGRRSGPA